MDRGLVRLSPGHYRTYVVTGGRTSRLRYGGPPLLGLKMGCFTVGETVWIKRGTLTSAGVSVRSAEDWIQVELRKKGGTTGQQKGVWLVGYGEEEVEMKKQQLKRQRPGDRQPVAASQPISAASSPICLGLPMPSATPI